MKDQAESFPKANLLFQFKITLLEARPAIWRRIQVPDCVLPIFHKYIQAAMGWENCHMHLFDIHGVQYSLPFPDDDDLDMDFEDETSVLLSELLPNPKRKVKCLYEYDFGDSWRHEVLFEEAMPPDPKAKYPLCLEGARACPPEDCGGVWGYGDFLEAIRDPKHEEHKNMLEWVGFLFDPEAFDANAATKAMRKVK